MRTYYIAQGTLLGVCGDLNVKKIKKEVIYIHIRLIHFVIEQKLIQQCKVTIQQ